MDFLNEHEDIAVGIEKVSFESISPARMIRRVEDDSTVRLNALAIGIDITGRESQLCRMMVLGSALGPFKEHQIGLACHRFDGQPAIVRIRWIRCVSRNLEAERIL